MVPLVRGESEVGMRDEIFEIIVSAVVTVFTFLVVFGLGFLLAVAVMP